MKSLENERKLRKIAFKKCHNQKFIIETRVLLVKRLAKRKRSRMRLRIYNCKIILLEIIICRDGLLDD